MNITVIQLYISYKSLVQECDKKEYVEVTGTATISCLKENCKTFVQYHVFARHCQAGAPVINIVNNSHRSQSA
jgi:hypothetical protein